VFKYYKYFKVRSRCVCVCAEFVDVIWIWQHYRIIKILKSDMKMMKENLYEPIPHINLLRTSRYI